MSGPIQEPDRKCDNEPVPTIEVREGRAAWVGGLDIVRVLPTKGRRTVGAWCFVDLMLPPEAEEPDPMEVGPHPHIGLSTVTWLFEGEAIHTDSLGTEQPIRPGQLNLMTAGNGIAHAELATMPGLHGVQMWVAQPELTRHGANRFEHHAELPMAELASGVARVLMGSLAGAESPATTETPLIGAELSLRKGVVEIPVDTTFEHCVVPIDRPALVGGVVVEPGWIGLVPPGHDSIRIDPGDSGGRVMVLGGVPVGERIQMWWNFVARTRDELDRAYRDWQAHDTDRFGPVPSSLRRIDAPAPPWATD
ncbi:MAG: pirin family protein [Acidimicrobiia bacterium]